MGKTTDTELHYITSCQYGFVHNQCTCPSEDKALTQVLQQVRCDDPNHIPGDRKEKVSKRLAEYKLRTAGSNLRDAEEVREQRLVEVRKAVKAASKAGYSKTQIALTVGLSRNAVHNMLQEGK